MRQDECKFGSLFYIGESQNYIGDQFCNTEQSVELKILKDSNDLYSKYKCEYIFQSLVHPSNNLN